MGTQATVIVERDTAELSRELSKYQLSIQGFEIKTEQDYIAAGDLLKAVADRRKRAWEWLSEDIETANKLHKSLTTKRNALAAPWDAIRQTIEKLMRSARARWDEEAAEARRKQDEAAAELLKAAQREARKLAKSGDIAQAQQMVAEAKSAISMAPAIEPIKPKVEGVKDREVWTGKCDDVMALLKAVAEGKIALMQETRVQGQARQEALFTVNERVLNQMADRLKLEFKWPGCRAVKDIGFSAGR